MMTAKGHVKALGPSCSQIHLPETTAPFPLSSLAQQGISLECRETFRRWSLAARLQRTFGFGFVSGYLLASNDWRVVGVFQFSSGGREKRSSCVALHACCFAVASSTSLARPSLDEQYVVSPPQTECTARSSWVRHRIYDEHIWVTHLVSEDPNQPSQISPTQRKAVYGRGGPIRAGRAVASGLRRVSSSFDRRVSEAEIRS